MIGLAALIQELAATSEIIEAVAMGAAGERRTGRSSFTSLQVPRPVVVRGMGSINGHHTITYLNRRGRRIPSRFVARRESRAIAQRIRGIVRIAMVATVVIIGTMRRENLSEGRAIVGAIDEFRQLVHILRSLDKRIVCTS